MRVNRIYFRGLKSFKRLLFVGALAPILAGCTTQRVVSVQAKLISSSPMVVDLNILGVCPNAQIKLEAHTTRTIHFPLLTTQKQGKSGQNPYLNARILLHPVSHLGGRYSPISALLVDCQSHGQFQIDLSGSLKKDSRHQTPDWAKGLVWYQVFPERFLDGNASNSPNGWDLAFREWGSSFGEAGIEEIELAWNRSRIDPRKFPYSMNASGGALEQVVFARRFGGDLMGVYQQLEKLKQDGFTGIYLCPVFQSRSLHKYDADDHRHIDPTLGHPGIYYDPGPKPIKLLAGEDPADEQTWEWTTSDRWFVDVFLPKARALGLRVILDGVWNHVGTNHFAFADVMEHGIESAYVDWFDVEFDEEGNLFAWKSWGGGVNGNLPIFKQTKVGDLAPGPKAHMMAVTRRWMDPNNDGDPSDGIDGWRLDVAGEIGDAFWKDWRQEVRALNPDALTIAEIWNDADSVLHSDGFDGQMNYPFAYAIADWLSIGESKGDVQLCAQRLEAVFHHEPQHDLVQMNLMSSHDTERLVSLMRNDFPRGYDRGASPWDRSDEYEGHQIEFVDYERALIAIAAMVASPGSVMIYNGDEYAMGGADDPDNRRPIPWQELGEGHPEDIGMQFHRAVVELVSLRSEPRFEHALRFGTAEFRGLDSGELVIIRQLGNYRVEFILPGSPGVGESSGSMDYESSRKIGLEGGSLPIRVRVLYGDNEELIEVQKP